jgi:hypothetical protein
MTEFVPNTEGVFPGLSEEEYRAAPGIGQSLLKAFDAEPTPAHFIESLSRPKEVTEAMEFGTILHTAILQPDLLSEAYYVKPEPWDGRTTACKVWKTAHQDRPVITKEQEDSIPKIKETVLSLPVAGDIIRTGQKEVSFFKRDEETGLLLKCRVDAIATDTDGNTHLVDLKKVRRAHAAAERFSVQCVDRGYDVQCASYLHITGASRFVFVAMEDEPPFDAELWELDAKDVAEGLMKWRSMLSRYAAAVAEGTWPGYTRAVKKLTLPPWAKLKERREADVIYGG